MAVRVFRTAPSSTSPSTVRPANSFGAFLPKGITLRVNGDANDYVGKGALSGDASWCDPSKNGREGYMAEDNIIGGNVILFGATSGQAFLRAGWSASGSRA